MEDRVAANLAATGGGKPKAALAMPPYISSSAYSFELIAYRLPLSSLSSFAISFAK
jgi:hypothetical protein